jgi:hypothetical protein
MTKINFLIRQIVKHNKKINDHNKKKNGESMH